MWLTHTKKKKKQLCRNAQFGDLKKNHMYNYTSAILTSVIPKICLSHFQRSMKQQGICEMQHPQKTNNTLVWVFDEHLPYVWFGCVFSSLYSHMVETNRKVGNYRVAVCLHLQHTDCNVDVGSGGAAASTTMTYYKKSTLINETRSRFYSQISNSVSHILS